MQRSNARSRWQYQPKVGRTKSKTKAAQRRRTDATVPKQHAATLKPVKLRTEKQLFLGIKYRNSGIKYRNSGNDGEAVKWYRKAAQQGDVLAQINLGWMYQNGKGVLQDDAEAVRWYQKAAQQGNAKAQTSLGWMYQNGRGIPQNDLEAIKWYTRAAAQGDILAQYRLRLAKQR